MGKGNKIEKKGDLGLTTHYAELHNIRGKFGLS